MKCLVLNRFCSLVARSIVRLVPHGLTYPPQHGFGTPGMQIHRLAFEFPICATVMQLHTVH
jgi:hypothetical protein